MQAELAFAEQRLRHEMHEELGLRLQLQEKRCAERVASALATAEAHVARVRGASQTMAMSDALRVRREERVGHDALARAAISAAEERHAEELAQLSTLQRAYVLKLQQLRGENSRLHALVRTQGEAAAAKAQEAKRAQERDSLAIWTLERHAEAQEREIEMLREEFGGGRLTMPRTPRTPRTPALTVSSTLRGASGSSAGERRSALPAINVTSEPATVTLMTVPMLASPGASSAGSSRASSRSPSPRQTSLSRQPSTSELPSTFAFVNAVPHWNR